MRYLFLASLCILQTQAFARECHSTMERASSYSIERHNGQIVLTIRNLPSVIYKPTYQVSGAQGGSMASSLMGHGIPGEALRRGVSKTVRVTFDARNCEQNEQDEKLVACLLPIKAEAYDEVEESYIADRAPLKIKSFMTEHVVRTSSMKFDNRPIITRSDTITISLHTEDGTTVDVRNIVGDSCTEL